MGVPALGSRFAIKMATYYTILQSMFIFGCISCQYRLMVYHVSFTHVDITKMMPLRKIWDIFTQMSHTSSTQDSIDNKTAGAPLLDSERQLNKLLSSYKSGHSVPIHVYKVLPCPTCRVFPSKLTTEQDALHTPARRHLTACPRVFCACDRGCLTPTLCCHRRYKTLCRPPSARRFHGA